MAMKLDTLVTSRDMDHLWGEVNKTREGSLSVKLNKEVVTRLLLDHGKLLNYYEKNRS